MTTQQNKKLTLGILLTFIICIGSAILATYSTGPYGNYPNPGIHPGMIGPGTFNDSSMANPQWNIPGDLDVSGKLDANKGIKVGFVDNLCNSSIAGTLRWNSTNSKLEICNGIIWHELGTSTYDGTCVCEGTSFEVYYTESGVVYVDCNADKCWTSTIGTNTWSGAVSYCSGLNYGGSDDWTLPTSTVLQNLCNSNSCLGTCFGGDGLSTGYWSSTAISGGSAYHVMFDNCFLGTVLKLNSANYVRCVRG
ncbi:MAG: DUF1566 domain-containing protein [Candidatus Aenigmarchaeota archaeon]|nr:DUF1566 domain-containing protein [Candidatus Aenigmarchaeota archaeon]